MSICTSCNQNNNQELHWSSPDYYEIRFKNLTKLNSLESAFSSSPCVDIIVLQSTACRECSKYKIQEIINTKNQRSNPTHFLFIADSLSLQIKNLILLLETDSSHVHLVNYKVANEYGINLPEIMNVTFCEKKYVTCSSIKGNAQN
jgi:hypothetical protein